MVIELGYGKIGQQADQIHVFEPFDSAEAAMDAALKRSFADESVIAVFRLPEEM